MTAPAHVPAAPVAIIDGREAFGAVIIRPAPEGGSGSDGIDIDIVAPGITHHGLAYVLRSVADRLDAA